MRRRTLGWALLALGSLTVPRIADAGPATSSSSLASSEAAEVDASSEAAALVAELRRSVSKLELEDAPRPYEGIVRIVRAQALTLDGSYGGIIADLAESQAFGRLDLRVGSAQRDASNFFGGMGLATLSLPLDAGSGAAASARALWRVADAAYREAVSTFRSKEAALRQLADNELPDDRGPGPAVEVHLPWVAIPQAGAEARLTDAPKRPRIDGQLDRPGLRAAVAELSARFADHPQIDNGDVVLQVIHHDETHLDHRGAAWGDTRVRAFLAVVADTRAEDGMHLDHGAVIHLQSIPTPEMVRAQGAPMVDRVLAELEALRAAPMLDEDYDGPVLFSATAAGQLLASTVAPHATGSPAPLSEWGRVVELEPHWLERLGRPVFPPWLGLTDDPGAEGFGHYLRDAEGMPGRRLELVKRGVLSELLMSRRPNEKIEASNGHARASFDLSPAPSISNLELRASRRGLSRARMERELLRRAREDGYDYAYVVEALRDGGVLGSPPRDTATLFGSGRKVGLPLPARLFRLEADGTRTLVRGAIFSPVAMRALRRVREVGQEVQTLALRIVPGVIGGWAVDLGVEGLLTQTVDAQVRTPALLIDGFELVVERGENERLPFLTHPLRRAEAGDRAGFDGRSETDASEPVGGPP